MNKEQQEARVCLAKSGPLTDPKYAPHPAKAEKELQEAVRRCWAHRKHFPSWLEGYIAKWATESAAGAGVDAGSGTGLSGGDGTATVLTP